MTIWINKHAGFAQVSRQGSSTVVCFTPSVQKKTRKTCPNVSEWPNDPVLVNLSEILEPNAPAKYDLTAKACAGILNRAQRRGKAMPEFLAIALKMVSQRKEPLLTMVPSLHGFRLVAFGEYVEDEAASTMKARDYKDATDLVVAVEMLDEDTSMLGAMHETGHGFWKMDDCAGTLRCEGENRPSRPSHVVATVFQAHAFDARQNEVSQYGDCAGALTASDSTGAQAVAITTNRSPGLVRVRVRRLTPTEGETLQGFPRGWTDVPYKGKPAADTNRYKMMGNSWAIPVVAHCGERMNGILEGTIDASSATAFLSDIFSEGKEDDFFIFR